MSQELHLWCCGSHRYTSAVGTLRYTVFTKKCFFTNILRTKLKLGVLNCCCRNSYIFLNRPFWVCLDFTLRCQNHSDRHFSGNWNMFFTCFYRSPSQAHGELDNLCSELNLLLTNINNNQPVNNQCKVFK